MSAQIIQLHSENADANISAQIISGLRRPAGQKELPTILLYDERGLQLYDDITTKAPEYYLFGAEEEILKNKADEIVQVMHHGETQVSAGQVVLELGAGLSKLVPSTSSCAPITYYALDLQERELQRALGEITASEVGHFLEGKVNIKGLCGTYNDGLKFVSDGGLHLDYKRNSVLTRFGRSSLVDVSPISSADSSIFSSGDSGLEDSDPSPISTPDEAQLPLHILFLGASLGNFSREGAAEFLKSLPLRAGSGDNLLIGLDHDNDKAVIETAYNDPQNHTKAFIMNGLRVAGKALCNEAIFSERDWEYVNRYNSEQRQHEAFFKSKCDQSIEDSSSKVPYSFLKDELVKIEQSYKPHSNVPEKDEDWPPLASILQFQSRVRARLLKLYSGIKSHRITLTRKIARVLFMTYEHEAQHAETLLYMLLQRAGSGTLPPAGFAIPPWTSLATAWNAAPLPETQTVTLGPAVVTLGHDDSELNDADPILANDVDGHAFGWDNEHGVRQVRVGKFSIEWRPVTNGEFLEFYSGKGQDLVQVPVSWIKEDGEFKVRTLYGPVSMNIARHWPVTASYNDLSTYAIAKGGRIPTEAELRLFYDTFDSGYGGGANVGFRNWHPIP
ncbi:hypothetical protein C0993_000588, partial [Termitomyces sp. T159_Od127]